MSVCIRAWALVTLQLGDWGCPKAVAIISMQLLLSSPFISLFSSSCSQLCDCFLPDISTLTSQTLSKQLPRVSIRLCARAPFWQKQLVCIFGCRQLISEALSALIISGGLRGSVAPDTLSHSSSSANTGLPLPIKRLCLH